MKGCARCDGGWVTVQQAYVERHAPLPPPLTLEQTADPGLVELHEALVADVETRRRALVNTAYPCKECNTAAFYRWAGGHLEINHDRSLCGECKDLDAQRRPTRKGQPIRDLARDGPSPAAGTLPPPERSDLF